VIAAAALATLKEITESNLIALTLKKELLIRQHLKHSLIKNIRGKGLMLAAILPSSEIATQVILKCKEAGLLLFWLLFEPNAIRITPPLTINDEEIIKGCKLITQVLDSINE